MIPNKKKTDKVQNYPTTELQKLAQKENFALFILASMKGQLIHLYQCKSLDREQTKYLQSRLVYMTNEIKTEQRNRKAERSK